MRFFSVLGRRWGTLGTLLLSGGAILALGVGAVSRARASAPAPSKSALESLKSLDQALAERSLRREALESQVRSDRAERRDLEGRLGALHSTQAEIDRQIDETRSKEEKLRARVRALEGDEHRLREGIPAGNEEDALVSPVLTRLRAEMDRIRAEIALGGLDRPPESPDYKKWRARLAELELSLRVELYKARAQTIVELKDQILGVEEGIRTLDERRQRRTLEAKRLLQEVKDLPSPEAALADLNKEIEASERERRRLLALAAPEAGRPPAASNWWIAWGAVGVVGLAILGSFWREAADLRVRTDGDVKRRLNLPVISLLKDMGDDPLILRRHPHDPLCEAMSTAATVLRSYLAGREFRTVAVTSAGAGEGKTTVAVNFACALARKGLNVLLVDADLRRPRIHEIYRLDNSVGLSTILLGPEPAEPEPDPNEIIVQTEIPTLRLLGSGPTNEIVADLHDSPRMIDFLRAQRERFDVIILDAAPLYGLGDSVALARIVDTSVWVVRSGWTDGRTLGWSKHLLKTVHADVAGVILNFAPSSRGEHLYRYPPSLARTT